MKKHIVVVNFIIIKLNVDKRNEMAIHQNITKHSDSAVLCLVINTIRINIGTYSFKTNIVYI